MSDEWTRGIDVLDPVRVDVVHPPIAQLAGLAHEVRITPMGGLSSLRLTRLVMQHECDAA